MIDFVQATKHLSDKDRPFFGDCELVGRFNSGWMLYRLQGCDGVEIRHNPAQGWLTLKGSIMYYWQGHNFTYSKAGFVEAVAHIGKLLHVSLWDAIVNIFEYGVIMQVERKPREYILRHSPKPSGGLLQPERGKDNGNFRWWEGRDRDVSLKMYDAGRNIRCKQGMRMKDIIKAAGWNPESHYLKWEVHYIKPEASLNNGIGIRLCDIVNSQWEDIFKADIFAQYKRLTPMKSIIPPKDKSNLHALDIFAIELVETKMNEGSTLPEVQKMLYSRINASAILSKADKDARKRQVKATLDKLEQSEVSAWDISRELKAALELADEPQA